MSKNEQEFKHAVAKREDRWVVALEGKAETVVTPSGRTLLLCYNPAWDVHAYRDMDRGIILNDDQRRAAWKGFKDEVYATCNSNHSS